MSWTKSFRTIPGQTAPGQKIVAPEKDQDEDEENGKKNSLVFFWSSSD